MNLVTRILSKEFYQVLFTTFALVIGSNLTVPFYPVEFTFQTFIVTLALLFNPKVAFKSTTLYLFLGLVGLPVFAGFSNAHMALNSLSLGYLIGLVIAPFIIYQLNVTSILSKILVFNAVVFSLGVSVLALHVGLNIALYGGLVVFIIPELIKTIAAYLIYKN